MIEIVRGSVDRGVGIGLGCGRSSGIQLSMVDIGIMHRAFRWTRAGHLSSINPASRGGATIAVIVSGWTGTSRIVVVSMRWRFGSGRGGGSSGERSHIDSICVADITTDTPTFGGTIAILAMVWWELTWLRVNLGSERNATAVSISSTTLVNVSITVPSVIHRSGMVVAIVTLTCGVGI